MKRLHLCRHPLLPTFCATWAFRWMRPEKRVALFLLTWLTWMQRPFYRLLSCLMLTATIVLSQGCTLGPTVEVRHVFIHPGQPLRVMENVTVDGERLDGGGAASHDVGGWIMMPPDHWAAVEKIVKQAQTAKP